MGLTYTLETLTSAASTREVIMCDGDFHCETKGLTHDEAVKVVAELNAGYTYA